MKDQYYIVRTERAGVFFCQIAERRGSEADLINARRVHYWNGATECIGLAKFGTNRPDDCRITASHRLTVLGVIEIIPCDAQSVESLTGVKVWTV